MHYLGFGCGGDRRKLFEGKPISYLSIVINYVVGRS